MGVRDLDAVMADLMEIRGQLEALDPADNETRRQLLARREELRAEAREIEAAADPAGSAARLRRELEILELQWQELADKRIDVVKQAGGGSLGGDFGFATHAMDVNREIDSAGSRDEIEARIAEIKAQLEELEG
jgi:hypothetical protein